MFDLNKIVTDALTAAVQQAIAPLVEQIAVLERRIDTLSSQHVAIGERLAALENNPAIGTDTTLEQRVVALEERPATAVAGVITPEMIVESMNKAEWLWEKVNAYIETGIEDRIERAIDDHCSTYDHDDYDNVYSEWGGESVDDFVKDRDIEDQIEETVKEVLNNATFSVSV
jgi:hypothetical protein